MSEQPDATAVSSLPPRRIADLLATAAVLYLLPALAPSIDAGSLVANHLLSVAVTLLFTALAVLWIAQLAPCPLTARGETLIALVAVVVWPVLIHLGSLGPVVRLYVYPLINLLFVLLCVMCGRLLSRVLREPNILLPVGLVAILADIFTVFLGPTGKALEVAPELVERFSVGLPEAGSAAGPEGAAGLAMLAGMGVGDFVFLALFLTAAARFGFPLRRGGVAIIVLMCLAIVSYLMLPLLGVELPGIPLLPFIAGGFLLAYWRRFRLSPAERQGLVWGALLLVIILLGIMLLTHGAPSPEPSANALEGVAPE